MEKNYNKRREEFRREHGFYIKDWIKFMPILFIILLLIIFLANKVPKKYGFLFGIIGLIILAISHPILKYLKRIM